MKTITMAALLSLPASSALAQGYPKKPLRLVVPCPPGGSIDITARTISPGLSELLCRTMHFAAKQT